MAAGHGVGRAWQVDFIDVVEGVLDQAAAVKALAWAAAAPAVRGAEHVDRTAEHIAALLWRHGSGDRQRPARTGTALGALLDLVAADVLVWTHSSGIGGVPGETVR
ncbi:hypothetical protein D3C76_1483420 [compost metagenome]